MADAVTFGDYLRQALWPRVAAVLQRAYPQDFTGNGFTLADYQELFEEFRRANPAPTALTICLERVVEGDEVFVDVFGRYPNDPAQRWAIELFVPAGEWVAAPVEAPADMTADEIVAHALAEWAWGGLDLAAHRPYEPGEDAD